MECIQSLVDCGIDASVKNNKGNTALNLMCQRPMEKGVFNCVRLLVEDLKVDPDNKKGENSLHCLFKSNLIHLNKELIEVFLFLIDQGSDVNAQTIKECNNPLQCLLLEYEPSGYCCEGDEDDPTTLSDVISIFIENGVDIQSKNAEGENVLHLLTRLVSAADEDNCRYKDEDEDDKDEDYLLFDCFRLLFDAGMDLNITTSQGQTCLHISCSQNNNPPVGLIKFFIEKGIDPQAKDSDGFNALHRLCSQLEPEEVAEELDEENCFGLLIDSGIDVNAKTNDGDTVLHLFVSCICRIDAFPSIFVLQFLIEKGLDVHATNKTGDNALHLLCRHLKSFHFDLEDEDNFISLLVESGLDVNSKTADGDTVLHLLYRKKCPPIPLGYLIEKGVDVHATTEEGETALHLLCRYCGYGDMQHLIRLLVDAGIDIKAQTNNGSSAEAILRERNQKHNIRNLSEILHLLNSLL